MVSALKAGVHIRNQIRYQSENDSGGNYKLADGKFNTMIIN
jgi:hypothetical protein